MSKQKVAYIDVSYELFEDLLPLPDGCKVFRIVEDHQAMFTKTIKVIVAGEGLPDESYVSEGEQIGRLEPVYKRLENGRVIFDGWI